MSFFPRVILLATDGSEESALALEAAVDLSNKTESDLHVVHVALMSFWVYPDTTSSEQAQGLRREAQKLLDLQVEKVEKAGGTVAHAHLRMGRADAEVVRLGEEIEAGLIVMGSRGVSTITRILLGSDAESTVRHAHCPVMIVRPEE
jgi:nucleotide-binding universal stress UspA family protein